MLRPFSTGDMVSALTVLVQLGRFLPQDLFEIAIAFLTTKEQVTGVVLETPLGACAVASLPDALLARVLDVLPQDAAPRARLLKAIVPRLPAVLVERAYEAADTIPDGYYCAAALSALALRLPQPKRGRAVRRTLALAIDIRNAGDRAGVLTDLAPVIDHGALKQALDKVKRHPEGAAYRTALLDACAKRMPRAELLAAAPELLRTARRPDIEPAVQVRLIAMLAGNLLADEAKAAIAFGRDAAARIEDGLAKIEALAALAPLLPKEEAATLLGEAMDMAEGFRSRDYVHATITAMPSISEGRRAAVAKRALEVAAKGEPGWAFSAIQVEGPVDLAKFLPKAECAAALLQAFRQSRGRLPFPGSERLLPEMAQRVPKADLLAALRAEMSAVADLSDIHQRGRRLRALAPLTKTGELKTEWEQAVRETTTLARAILDVRERADALGDLADIMTATEGEEVVREALAPLLTVPQDPTPKPEPFAPLPMTAIPVAPPTQTSAAEPPPQYFVTRVLGQGTLPDIAVVTLPGQAGDGLDLTFIRTAMTQDESIRPVSMSGIESGQDVALIALQQVILEAVAQQQLDVPLDVALQHAELAFRAIPVPIMNSPLSGLTLNNLTSAAGGGALAFMAAFGSITMGQVAVYLLVLGATRLVIGSADALTGMLKEILPLLARKWLGLPPSSSKKIPS